MFECIDKLVTTEGFTLKAWDDWFSEGGVWLVCTQNQNHADEIQGLSQSTDEGMPAAIRYLLSTDWLPVVKGASLIDAMTMLESRLALLPSAQLHVDSQWGVAVRNALHNCPLVRDPSTRDDRSKILPKTLVFA